MPSKLRILAGYLYFCPHKNLIFSVRRRFSRSDGDSSVAEVCPPQRDSTSPKGRSQDAHSAAQHRVSLRCTHGGSIVRLDSANFRDGSRAKAVLTTPRHTPSGLCARSTRACLLSSGDFFCQCGSAAMAARTLRCN